MSDDDRKYQEYLDRKVAEIREKYEREKKAEDDRRLEEYLVEFRHKRRRSEIEREAREANQKNEEACRKDIEGYYASAYYNKN